MDFETLKLEETNGVATIILNRPHAMNAMNLAMFQELEAALRRIRGARALMITGEGKAFCSGADMELVTLLRELPENQFMDTLRYLQRVITMVEEMDLPVIAAINGFALGGGLDLALACDLRIAVEGAKLGEHYVRVGVVPDLGGTQRLAKIIGLGKAKEMIFLGEMISSEEAERIGLVYRVVPKEQWQAETHALLKRMAEGPSVAYTMAKRAIHGGLEGGIRIGMELEVHGQRGCMATNDVKEGITAFQEKRPPRFSGA